MAFVMSPSGAMFPATPGNVAAYGEGKVSSNVKPEKKMDAVNSKVNVSFFKLFPSCPRHIFGSLIINREYQRLESKSI